MGYDADRLAEMRRLIEAPDSDIFDVLAYVRFELVPSDPCGPCRAGCATRSWLRKTPRCAPSSNKFLATT